MNYNKNPQIISLVHSSLKEDIGKRDITTELVIPKDKFIRAVLWVKEDCVVCGLDIAKLVFKTKDNKIQFKSKVLDGKYVKKGTILAQIQGKARPILTAERVALNFLCLLSGIATKTRKYVEVVKPYKVNPAISTAKSYYKVRKGGVRIMDTRKTIPGLRELEKYAVRTGGGCNHRLKLDEMVLIKDNHIRVMGYGLWVMGLKKVIKKIRKETAKKINIEIEVSNLREFQQVLQLRPDIIMLDNMSIKDIKKAVKIKNNSQLTTHNSQLKLEASGGITLKNIKKIASMGIDAISIGTLTNSVKSIDISLEVK